MEIEAEKVPESNLIVDAIYKSITSKSIKGDVLSKIFKVGNSGGFRKSINNNNRINYMVLYTSGENVNWVDEIDIINGLVSYYGDNKTPGKILHDTKNGGNEWLEEIFINLHEGRRELIPPIFLFQKHYKRDLRYIGLLVPGQEGLQEDLIALWKSENGERYQNYKAFFTILDESEVSKEWIESLENNLPYINEFTPKNWANWSDSGKYTPLISKPVEKVLSKEEQLPKNSNEVSMIQILHRYFSEKPTEFEKCASKLFLMMDTNVISCDVTQPSRDGGRDAIGQYRIGNGRTPVLIEFALEAKCYQLDNSVGVKELSRLISRIKNREFGVFITTSFIGKQAYKEFIVEDNHPIIVLTAVDIVNILKNNEITSSKILIKWLQSNFPIQQSDYSEKLMNVR